MLSYVSILAGCEEQPLYIPPPHLTAEEYTKKGIRNITIQGKMDPRLYGEIVTKYYSKHMSDNNGTIIPSNYDIGSCYRSGSWNGGGTHAIGRVDIQAITPDINGDYKVVLELDDQSNHPCKDQVALQSTLEIRREKDRWNMIEYSEIKHFDSFTKNKPVKYSVMDYSLYPDSYRAVEIKFSERYFRLPSTDNKIYCFTTRALFYGDKEISKFDCMLEVGGKEVDELGDSISLGVNSLDTGIIEIDIVVDDTKNTHMIHKNNTNEGGFDFLPDRFRTNTYDSELEHLGSEQKP